MERIWQWAWDRHGPRYSWALYAISSALVLPIYIVLSFVVVAHEESGHYVEAATATVVGVLVGAYLLVLPRLRGSRLAERWRPARTSIVPKRWPPPTPMLGGRSSGGWW